MPVLTTTQWYTNLLGTAKTASSLYIDTPHDDGGAVWQGVRCVIHYQIPASVDIYVHRSGRTARGSADGLAVALVAPKEAARYAALQQVTCRRAYTCYMLKRLLTVAFAIWLGSF